MKKDTFGRYEIKRKLGQGGMGSVFHAYDPNFKRNVALKLLDRRFFQDPKFRRRFEREARVVAQIDHPGVVTIYDFGEDEGYLFLVMPLMEGGTLTQRLKERPLTLDEIIKVFKSIGPALDETHRRKLVHRDLKPDNILYDGFGKPHVADFGIVKVVEGGTTLTADGIVGTPAYMSPEQVGSSKQLDGRSDIYSLGIILFEMLTGERPFKADTGLALAMMHIMNPVPSILEVRPDLPIGMETIIQKVMHKKAEERYQTVAELVAALEDIENLPEFGGVAGDSADSQSLITEMYRSPEQAEAETGGRKISMSIIGLIALILIGGGIGIGSFVSSRQPTPTPILSIVAAITPSATVTNTPESSATPTHTATVESTLLPIMDEETVTPSVTPTVTLTPTPVLEAAVITANNLDQLTIAAQPTGSSDVVNGAAVSPDELFVAVATSGGVRLLQLPELIEVDIVLSGDVSGVAWSPNGRFLATSGPDNAIHILDTTDWSEENQLNSNGSVLAWSPNNDQLLIGSRSGSVVLWEIANTDVTTSWTDHSSGVTAVSWSPDGTQFASGSSDDFVHVYDINEGSEIRSTYRQDGVADLAWSPDGNFIATAGGDGVVRLETASGQQPRSLNCTGDDPLQVVWLGNETVAVGSADGRIRICPIEARAPERELGGHADVIALVWLPENGRLVSVGGRDKTVQLWKRDDGSRTVISYAFAGYDQATVVEWSPNGELLAIGTEAGTVVIWSRITGVIVSVTGGHAEGVNSVAWSADGLFIATGGQPDNNVRVWEASTGALVVNLVGHRDVVTAVTWGADSNIVASSGFDTDLQLWSVTDGDEADSFPLNAQGAVLDTAWSPDGSNIAVVGQTGWVQLRPPNPGELTVTLFGHNSPVNAVAWRSDSSRFATGDNNGQLSVWDANADSNDDALLNIEIGAPIRSLMWSPDGAMLAATVGTSGRFFNASGDVVGQLSNQHSFNGNMTWSADGKWIADVGSDGTVRVWHVLAEQVP
ncbi:MAG: protein kinase [Chloroflexi bacterium]|nr:protein kinase [Chloroflexota bacterium]